jgi:hypothetical protein
LFYRIGLCSVVLLFTKQIFEYPNYFRIVTTVPLVRFFVLFWLVSFSSGSGFAGGGVRVGGLSSSQLPALSDFPTLAYFAPYGRLIFEKHRVDNLRALTRI